MLGRSEAGQARSWQGFARPQDLARHMTQLRLAGVLVGGAASRSTDSFRAREFGGRTKC
ncbi:hypothetical protein X743_01080 [Mesorhizobium sp. LNHC252B00]|nr:hypothetical protein X743_01080 [Mesorhizobium sp. LNHC252B00]